MPQNIDMSVKKQFENTFAYFDKNNESKINKILIICNKIRIIKRLDEF